MNRNTHTQEDKKNRVGREGTERTESETLCNHKCKLNSNGTPNPGRYVPVDVRASFRGENTEASVGRKGRRERERKIKRKDIQEKVVYK